MRFATWSVVPPLWMLVGAVLLQSTLGYALCTGTVSVLDYGADPTGNADSRAAIQAAINYVHNGHSPGIVCFPAGRYKVKVNEDLGWVRTDVTPNMSVGVLFMYPNITLQGEGMDNTTIFIAAADYSWTVFVPPGPPPGYEPHNVPPYWAMIEFPNEPTHDPYGWWYIGDSTGFKMYDLTLDGDSSHNRVDLITTSDGSWVVNPDKARQALSITYGTGIDVRRVRLKNFTAANTVNIGTNLAGWPKVTMTMANCDFSGVGGGNTIDDRLATRGAWLNADYDVSALYVSTRTSQAMRGPDGPGSFDLGDTTFQRRTDNVYYGVRVAMELHGGSQNVHGVTVTGFTVGANLTGDHEDSTQTFTNNTFVDVGGAFNLWPILGLTGTRIANNNITVNPDFWLNAEQVTRTAGFNPPVGAYLAAIQFVNIEPPAGNPPYVLKNLRIESNTINYGPQSRGSTQLFPPDSSGAYHCEWGSAIAIGAVDDEVHGNGYSRNQVQGIVIQNNQINRPLANGIFFNMYVDNATISNNTIVDSGSCPFNIYCPGCPDEWGNFMPDKYTAAVRIKGADTPPFLAAAGHVYVPGPNHAPNTFRASTVQVPTMGYGIYTDRTPNYEILYGDFVSSSPQVFGIPYYQDSPRKGWINCDFNQVTQLYDSPCSGWILR